MITQDRNRSYFYKNKKAATFGLDLEMQRYNR